MGRLPATSSASIYERDNIKTKTFPLFAENCTFTDDSVCTLAVAQALLERRDFQRQLAELCPSLSRARLWRALSRMGALGPADGQRLVGQWRAHCGVSPVAYAAADEAELMTLAAGSAMASHDHPDAVAGAQAAALAIFLALRGGSSESIKTQIVGRFGYDLNRQVDDIRPNHGYDLSAKGTVPVALICALGGGQPRGRRAQCDFHSAAIVTPWPVLPAPWPKRVTACRTRRRRR